MADSVQIDASASVGPRDRAGAWGRAFHSSRRAPRRRCIRRALRASDHRSPSETGIDFLNYIRKEASRIRSCAWICRGTHRTSSRVRTKPQSRSATPADRCREHVAVFAGGDLSRLPAVQTAVAGAMPQMEDILRLTLRRRVPLPDVARRRAAICHDRRRGATPLPGLDRRPPVAFRSRSRKFARASRRLAPRHGQDSIEAAIRELLRFGFLVVSPGD